MRPIAFVLALSVPLAAVAQDDGTSSTPTSTPAAPASAPDTTSGTASAEKLLAKGTEADLIRARGDLERLVAAGGASDAWAWYLLGVSHYKLGAWPDAADAFSRATQLDRTLPMAWVGLGEAERMMGDVDTALRRFDRGLDAVPGDGLLLEARVRALRLSGRADEAIAAAKEALKENALQFGLYHEMGQAWLAKGNSALASFVFEKAETIPGGSEDAIVQADIGWTRYLLGEGYAAKKRLERAVELDPTYLPALTALARVRFDDRDYAAMVGLLEKASELDAESPSIWMDLGVAYRGLGRGEDAKKAFTRARELAPRDPNPLFNLGVLYADELKDYDLAIDKLNAYIDEGGAKVELAKAYLEDVEKEKKRVERQRKRDEDKRKREEERKRNEELLQQQKKEEAAAPAEGGGGDAGSGGDPWGSGDGQGG